MMKSGNTQLILRTNKYRILAITWFISIMLFVLPSVGHAQTTMVTATWNLPTILGEPTIRLEGYRPTVALDIMIPPGWEVASSAQVNLDYRLSELASEGVALAVHLNEQPIESVYIEPFEGMLTIEIPNELFIPGENKLELVAFLPLEDDTECIVPNHPGRWLEIGPNSVLNMSLEPTTDGLVLSDFPAHFELLGNTESAAPITFVIPDTPSTTELNAIAAVGYALAQSSETTPKWQFLPASEYQTAPLVGPVIIVGLNESMSSLDLILPESGSESGWISLTRGTSFGFPTMVVGGGDGDALLMAARSLSNPIALAQMSNDFVIVDKLPELALRSLPDEFTFADLGYGERVLRGSGEQSLIYTFDVPFAWTPENGQVSLNFSHSANLDPQVASLTVVLNGQTAVGFRLDALEEASNIAEISLPKEFFRPGRNFLRLTFDFGPAIVFCKSGGSQQSWASIRSDSSLALPHQSEGGRLDLKDFPLHLASETDTAALAVVLPENNSFGDLTTGLELIRSLSVANNRISPQLIRPENIESSTRAGHLILLGHVDQQPLYNQLRSHLPFNIGDEPLANYGIRLPIERPDMGVLQVMRSPWEKNRAIIVISGESQRGYELAAHTLTNPTLSENVEDQLVFVWKGSTPESLELWTQNLPDIANVPVLGFVDRIFGDTFQPGSPYPLFILIFLTITILAIISILGVRWMRYRQENQSSGH